MVEHGEDCRLVQLFDRSGHGRSLHPFERQSDSLSDTDAHRAES